MRPGASPTAHGEDYQRFLVHTPLFILAELFYR